MTTFVWSVRLSTHYFCLVSYISSDGHFSVAYLYYLLTAPKSFLDVLYCRITALDKLLNSQVIFIRWEKVPKLIFKCMQTISGWPKVNGGTSRNNKIPGKSDTTQE